MLLQDFINEFDAIDTQEFELDAGQFGIAIDSDTGVLEVHVLEGEEDWNACELQIALHILHMNLLRLQSFKSSKDHCKEYRIAIENDKLVFYENPIDGFDLVIEERIAMAKREINAGISKLLEIESMWDSAFHNWREDGF